jgi:hypothetical protein
LIALVVVFVFIMVVNLLRGGTLFWFLMFEVHDVKYYNHYDYFFEQISANSS